MKYCEEYAALLDLFVDGELPPAQMAEVQTHLDTCPGCRAYVDDVLAIRAAFPEVKDTEVPAGFSAGVMAAIRADAAPRRKKRPRWTRAVLPLAACLALLILVERLPLRTGWSSSSTADTAAVSSEEPDTAADMMPSDSSGEAWAGKSEPAESYHALRENSDDASAAGGSTESALDALDDSTADPTPAEKSSTLVDDPESTYFTTLILPPEAADLLAEYTPFEEDEGFAWYELPGEMYEELLQQLDSSDFMEQLHPEVDSDTFLVRLRRS